MSTNVVEPVTAEAAPHIDTSARSWRDFPYWLVAMGLIFLWMIYLVTTQDRYNVPFDRISDGLRLTVEATAYGFAFALVLGLLAGLGRISRNVVARNVATFYIEFVRGVPMLVLIFTVTFAIVPLLSENVGLSKTALDFKWRAIIALALIYGAYLGEVFRAGIESIPRGQMEAGRSLGMSHAQTMRKIILPQAVRNMAPALGNDLIAMLKDTSLISVLGIREFTQNARLYAGSSFDYRPTYFVLTFFYLSMTVTLSLLVTWYRKRLGIEDRD